MPSRPLARAPLGRLRRECASTCSTSSRLTAGATEREVMRQALDQIAAADQAGLDGAWFAEHHFQRRFLALLRAGGA